MTSLRSGVKLTLMKKLLAILVLGLLWWNTSFANNLDNRLLGQTWTEITLECLTYDELEKKLINYGHKFGFNYIAVSNEDEKILVIHEWDSGWSPAEAIVTIDKKTGDWEWLSTFPLDGNTSSPNYVITYNIISNPNKPSEEEYPISVIRESRFSEDIKFVRDINEIFNNHNFSKDNQSYINKLRLMGKHINDRQKLLISKKKPRIIRFACNLKNN